MSLRTANELRHELDSLPVPKSHRTIQQWKTFLRNVIDTATGEEAPEAPSSAAPETAGPAEPEQSPPATDFFAGLNN